MFLSTKCMFISFLFAYLCGVTFASNNFISGVTNGYVVATISRKTSKKLDEKSTVFYYKEYLNECYHANADDKFVEISKQICQSDKVKEIFEYAKIDYDYTQCPTSEQELAFIGKKFCRQTNYWFIVTFICLLFTLGVYLLLVGSCVRTYVYGTDHDREYIMGLIVGSIMESMLNSDD